jgi:hypothetical protein
MMQHDKQMLPDSACPVDQLGWFVNHTLSTRERESIENHLATCPTCQAKVTAWTELRQAMRQVADQTPGPRADLFSQIEQQIDLLPAPAPLSWLSLFFQACWRTLLVVGEHFRVQARLIRRGLFWMPLLIVPLVGSMVYLPQLWQQTPGETALFAALLSALGMAFLYGPQIDPVREIALVTPTSPHLVLGVRCALISGYTLLLNCGLVLPFLAARGIVTPIWFLTNWLAPLCCLSAIALLLSILLSANASALICLILWSLRLLDQFQTFLFGDGRPEILWQQQYEHFWHLGTPLFGITIVALLLAFLVLERKEYVVQ